MRDGNVVNLQKTFNGKSKRRRLTGSVHGSRMKAKQLHFVFFQFTFPWLRGRHYRQTAAITREQYDNLMKNTLESFDTSSKQLRSLRWSITPWRPLTNEHGVYLLAYNSVLCPFAFVKTSGFFSGNRGRLQTNQSNVVPSNYNSFLKLHRKILSTLFICIILFLLTYPQLWQQYFLTICDTDSFFCTLSNSYRKN